MEENLIKFNHSNRSQYSHTGAEKQGRTEKRIAL
jgi:hypothetical protein